MTMKPKNVPVACEFGEIPVHQRNMFAVLDGMPLDTMVSHATCIVEGLREMAEDGVQSNGIGANVSWLMGENLRTVSALLSTIEEKLKEADRIVSEPQA